MSNLISNLFLKPTENTISLEGKLYKLRQKQSINTFQMTYDAIEMMLANNKGPTHMEEKMKKTIKTLDMLIRQMSIKYYGRSH